VTPDSVICYIEGKRYPRDACHRHHLNPQHAGGSDLDENLAWLCANAHSMVHRAATFVKTGRKGHAQDLAMRAYPSPAMRQRFWSVVNAEVLASQQAKEMGLHREEVTMEIPMPASDYARLKQYVADLRIDGKKVTIQDYVKRLVLSKVYSRR